MPSLPHFTHVIPLRSLRCAARLRPAPSDPAGDRRRLGVPSGRPPCDQQRPGAASFLLLIVLLLGMSGARAGTSYIRFQTRVVRCPRQQCYAHLLTKRSAARAWRLPVTHILDRKRTAPAVLAEAATAAGAAARRPRTTRPVPARPSGRRPVVSASTRGPLFVPFVPAACPPCEPIVRPSCTSRHSFARHILHGQQRQV